ncbi:coproporphyrinogen III oxidase [Amanita rubescens]|nr:coproporphyrinogen III oxidase [Amanita rubescens]
MSTMRSRMEEFIYSLQDEIVSSLENLDPSAPPFLRDAWQRPKGGSGKSCVFSSQSPNTILEKAGVNISIVYGTLPPAAIKQMRADHTSIPLQEGPEGLPYYAAGISLVIHPRNPHAPTVHANYRYFEITESSTSESTPKIITWWFGGGSDLTPSYLYEEDAIHFHSTIKAACDSHGTLLYPAFKKWCDEYFYITHRGESRGIGGFFFDDLHDGEHKRIPSSSVSSPATPPDRPRTADEIFAFIQDAGRAFRPSYLPILSKRHAMPYTDHHRRWQLLRRGRYVEFNLVIDRGTKFGLNTPGARIESILMSLPETARWEYMSDLGQEEGTEEANLLKVLKEPRDWVGV